VNLYLFFILISSILFPLNRATYSIGDTLTLEDQNLQYNVCHSDYNYDVGDIFSFSDHNGDLNGGNYKIFLISMNATW